eukprot:4974452-Heterocapsa_arctica.AAC.1
MEQKKKMWIYKLEELPSASRAGQEVKVKKLEQLMMEEAAYFCEQAAMVEKPDRRHGEGERPVWRSPRGDDSSMSLRPVPVNRSRGSPTAQRQAVEGVRQSKRKLLQEDGPRRGEVVCTCKR